MNVIQVPEQYPVEIGAFDANDRHRHVRIAIPGNKPQWGLCLNREELEAFVERYRAIADWDDPEQVYWVDEPWRWSGI